MLVGSKVAVFPVLVWCLSFIKDSITEKPKDCKKGKQYWSIDIFSLGTCASCPRNWKACYQQSLADEASCLRSCRVVKSEKPGATTNFNSTEVPLRATSKAPKVTNNASLAVVYNTPLRPPETEEDNGPKSHRVAEESLGAEILIGVGCFVGLMVFVIGVILWYRKKRSVQHRDEGDEEDQMGLHEPIPGDRNDREIQDDPDHDLEGQLADVVADSETLPLAIPEEQQRPIVHESSMKQVPIAQASSGANLNELQNTAELNHSSNLNLGEEVC